MHKLGYDNTIAIFTNAKNKNRKCLLSFQPLFAKHYIILAPILGPTLKIGYGISTNLSAQIIC